MKFGSDVKNRVGEGRKSVGPYRRVYCAPGQSFRSCVMVERPPTTGSKRHSLISVSTTISPLTPPSTYTERGSPHEVLMSDNEYPTTGTHPGAPVGTASTHGRISIFLLSAAGWP